MITDSAIIDANRHSIRHREEIAASDACGCFHCLEIFGPDRIAEWIDETKGGQTAFCPICGIDSVIGSKSGYPITKEFLGAMKSHWFDG